jgi:hypothetical protein
MPVSNEVQWFGAKCVFAHHSLSIDEEDIHYEERVVLVRAKSLDDAIQQGEREARRYASERSNCQYIEFINVFKLTTDALEPGTEVYSLMRRSTLSPSDFLDRYYNDGTECTQ